MEKLFVDDLIDAGFRPPFVADEKCRGTVVDDAGKFVPLLPMPGYLSDAARERGARMTARALNAEAGLRVENRVAA